MHAWVLRLADQAYAWRAEEVVERSYGHLACAALHVVGPGEKPQVI